MIAKAAPKRRNGRGSFTDLRHYLERDEHEQPRPDLVATWSGNVMSHTTADIEMERIAALGRVNDPVYHVILSWRPGEAVSMEVARGATEAVLRSVGAEDHQWYAALHMDEHDARAHLHLMLNRVHPVTLKALDLWRDNPKLARAAEWVEREFGCLPDRRMAWREYIAEVDLGFSIAAAEQQVARTIGERVRVDTPAAKQREMDAVRRAGYSWATLLEREAVPAALAVLEREDASWSDLHAVLETYHVHLERSGSGLRIVGAEPGQHLKASRVGLRFAGLEQRLGPYEASPRAVDDLSERLAQARPIVAAAQSWRELHERLEGLSLALERRGIGGRVRDLSGSGRSVALGRLETSFLKLTKRLGEYELPEALRAELERERARRANAFRERLGQLAAEPAALLMHVSTHHAVWTREDIEREIARVVGAERDELRETHGPELAAAADALVARCEIIGVEERRSFQGDGTEVVVEIERYSTAEIVAQERQAFAAIAALAQRSRVIKLEAASDTLDEQQRAAYAHLADGSSDLKVVTGIAGAGKSRLLREVCAAYERVGYRVVGTAVAGSAARVLGEEAEIQTRTLARLLIDLDRGRQKLDARSVIVLDEASMLGSEDARRLFEHARDRGARVLLLGDTRQHEAVARGPVLGEIIERHAACDLSMTRRAQEAWLRKVGTDLRAGKTARALDVLRERSCIAEHATTDEAMTALVGRYMADRESAGGEWQGLLIATRRADVERLNELVRETLRGSLGEERTYQTAFGKRAFAIGDRVITREPHRSSGTVNGDLWMVAGHRGDGRLELVRERDGVCVSWNLQENSALDHGYATTSYRSQGRTVDGAYVLATQAGAQRGMYVDVTRARKSVTIAYGRDELENFGALLDVVARDRSKLTVAALERGAANSMEGLSKRPRSVFGMERRLDHAGAAQEHASSGGSIEHRQNSGGPGRRAAGDRTNEGRDHEEPQPGREYSTASSTRSHGALSQRSGQPQEHRVNRVIGSRAALGDEKRPQLFVIAGPNGSGKTSWVDGNPGELSALGLAAHLNPDAIAREINPENAKLASAKAARAVLRRTTELLEGQESFGFETTLAGHYALRVLHQARDAGYEITLVYVATENPSINVERVAARYAAGGHFVPEPDIRRRYYRSLENLETAMTHADHVRLIDNSRDGYPHEFASLKGDRLRLEEPLPAFGQAAVAFLEQRVEQPRMEQSVSDPAPALAGEDLRVTALGRGTPWGADGLDAYVQAIKASPLRYAWNIERTESGVILRGVESEIHDTGETIVVHGEEGIAARSVVQLAALKQWERIDVHGTEAMVREVVLEAHDRDLSVSLEGIEVSDEFIESYQEAIAYDPGEGMSW